MIAAATVRRVAERRLYLVRHGEADGHDDESALTVRGGRSFVLIMLATIGVYLLRRCFARRRSVER